MSAKVLFLVLVLIESESGLLAEVNENATSLVENPRMDAEIQNATALIEKQRAEAEIQKILFGETPKIYDCVVTNATFKRNSTKYDNKHLWTVTIIKEEILGSKTLNVKQCSGSLIHPQVVLTVAHCVFKKSLTGLKVRAGEITKQPNKNSSFQQESQIENFTLFTAYDATNPKQDIALLFLKDPFKISNHVKTVCLPPATVKLDIDYVRCFTSGWKRHSHSLPGHSNFKKLNITVIPSAQCEQVLRLTRLGENFKLHKSFMCASGEFNKGTLDTNGGAPLVCPACETNGQMVQVGVMSWGFNNVKLPEVFASVSRARRWITEQLKEKGLKLSSCGIKWNEQQERKHLKVQ